MLILVLCCLVWGVNQVAIKVANTGISPAYQAGARSVIAALLLVLWARWRGLDLFQRDGTLWAGIAAGVLFAAEFLFLYQGLALTSASRGAVLLYCAPFVVALGSHLLVPGDRLTWTKTAGLLAAFAGVALAMGDQLVGTSRASLAGDLMCFIAAVMWGATTVLVRVTTLRTAPAEKTLLYQLVASAVALLAAGYVWGEPGVIALTPTVIVAFAYTAVIVAFISYAVWFWLIRTYPPSKVSAFTFLAPVLGVLAGVVLLGEPLTPTLVGALALVAAGIYLVNRPQQG